MVSGPESSHPFIRFPMTKYESMDLIARGMGFMLGWTRSRG